MSAEKIQELGGLLEATYRANGGSYAANTDSICLAILAHNVVDAAPSAKPESTGDSIADDGKTLHGLAGEKAVAAKPKVEEPEKAPAKKKPAPKK